MLIAPWILIALAAGIGVLQTQAALPSPAAWPMFAALVLAGAAGAVSRIGIHAWTRGIARGLVVSAAALAGFGYAAWRADLRLADALPTAWEGQDIVVVGVVDDLPRASDRGHRFALRVERDRDAGSAVVPSRLSLSWHGGSRWDEAVVDPPTIRAAERWTLHVRLRRPHGNINPGGFDLEAWLLERNLRATGFVRPDAENHRVDAFAGAPLDYVQRARETIRDDALRALDGARHANVLTALAIGDQSGIDERAWTVFNRTGVGHLISVSGLHVTVFALLAGAVAFGVARRFAWLTSRIPARKVAAAVGLAASFGYVLLAGAEVPAQRTLGMLAVSAIGLWIGRPGTGAVVWVWALVAVLAWDPWAVLAAGFWLSFFAVGLLIYIASGRLDDAPARGVARAWRELRTASHAQWAITARTRAVVARAVPTGFADRPARERRRDSGGDVCDRSRDARRSAAAVRYVVARRARGPRTADAVARDPCRIRCRGMDAAPSAGMGRRCRSRWRVALPRAARRTGSAFRRTCARTALRSHDLCRRHRVRSA